MCKKIILIFIIPIMFMSYTIRGNCTDDYDTPEEISCIDKNIIYSYSGIVESSESQLMNDYRAEGDDFDSYGLIGYMDVTKYDIYDQYNGLPSNEGCLDLDWIDDVSGERYY